MNGKLDKYNKEMKFDRIRNDEQEITSSCIITSNIFNDSFCSTATKLGNMNKPNVTYSHNYQKSIFLVQVTLDELMVKKISVILF